MLTPDALLELMETIESNGGVHLAGLCKGVKYKQAKHPGEKKIDRFTTRCNKPAKFIIPYVGEDDLDGTLIVCANDDRIDRWPRYLEKEVAYAGASDS